MTETEGLHYALPSLTQPGFDEEGAGLHLFVVVCLFVVGFCVCVCVCVWGGGGVPFFNLCRNMVPFLPHSCLLVSFLGQKFMICKVAPIWF